MSAQRRGQAGITLLEGLLSVGVIAAGLAIITTLQIGQINYEKAAVAAQQHRIVHYAARRFVRDKLGELLGETAQRGVTEILPGRLLAEGYLPDFMVVNGVLRLNPYAQTYRLLVRRTDGNKPPPTLELLTVTDGGKPLTATEAGRIVSIAGAEAGSMSLDGTRISGAYGSWDIPLAELPPIYRIAPGTLAMIAYFRSGTGAYVDAYAVNIPSRRDEYEELPTTDAIASRGGVGSLVQQQRDRLNTRRNNRSNTQAEEPVGRIGGSFGRSFNADAFTSRDRTSFLDEPIRPASTRPAPRRAPEPPPEPEPTFTPIAPTRAPVKSDNTAAIAGSACAPERSLAISTDNRNQTLVCISKVWQPVSLPIALHYGGLSQTGPTVNSQRFTLSQRGYLVADAAIGPVAGQQGITLTGNAGIQVNGAACQNSVPARTGANRGEFRCARVLEPGDYVIGSTDGTGGDARRAYHRLSFVVLPY
ncbi:MAG: hypothetical protein KI792_02465 [Alphaproteobacteria bacterium]|nr:hypothetical protein [Alphaproteobacteria bacterium SS10]